MESTYRQQIVEKEGTVFPAKTYKEMVLEPAFDQAKLNFIHPMIQNHYAHLIMLVEQGLVSKSEAVEIAKAVKKINIEELEKASYTGRFEDLFFQIEHFLIKEAGDIAGNLHIARSRNDMGIAIYRMTLRERLLKLIEAALNLR